MPKPQPPARIRNGRQRRRWLAHLAHQRRVRQVFEWNAWHRPGTPVLLLLDSGRHVRTYTAGRAYLLAGVAPVIDVDARAGSIALDRVQIIEW